MSERPFRIGLTGGIASGKSTVARLFAALGVPVLDADEIARSLVAPGQPLLARIVERFGPDVRASDGSLDRAALRTRIFADAQARAALENLSHPAILDAMEQRSAQLGGPYQLFVIPLLVEKNLGSTVDRVLLVDCEESLQIQRLQARDGASLEQARVILDAQASRSERRAAAQDVIVNDGDMPALAKRVAALHRQYLELAEQARR